MNELYIPLLSKLNNYGNDGNRTPINGTEVGNMVKGYPNLLALLPDNDYPAILEPKSSTNDSNEVLP